MRGDSIGLSVPKVELLKTKELPKNLGDFSRSLEGYSLAHANQPGFDVVQPMGQAMLMYECRYSEPPITQGQTSTQLTPSADVRRKAVIARTQVVKSQATVAGQTIDPSRSVYILVAHRDSSGDLDTFLDACNSAPAARHQKAMEIWDQFSNLEMPVMVLNRQALMQRYGPTFRLLGGFMMDYASRHHE